MDYWGFLEKGYGLLATKFKDYRLFVLHFEMALKIKPIVLNAGLIYIKTRSSF